MTRYARKQSSTGIYYIVIRGKERKEIFVDDDRDRCKEYATAEPSPVAPCLKRTKYYIGAIKH